MPPRSPLPWILVTPASRGIGFELTRQLLQKTRLPVVATVRKDEGEVRERLLRGLRNNSDGEEVKGLEEMRSRLDVLRVDVTDESTISAAASFTADKFSSSYLHLAFAVPGILHPEKSPSQISATDALETFKVNTLGPLLLAKHFSSQLPARKTTLYTDSSSPSTSSSSSSSSSSPKPPHNNTILPAQATFAIMAARVGSISDNRAGGWYSYRASKAATMQAVKSLDIWLRARSGGKAIAVGLHPGTVKTDLSRDFWNSVPAEKLFEVEFAAEKLIDVVSGLGREDGGKTWDWKGEEILP